MRSRCRAQLLQWKACRVRAHARARPPLRAHGASQGTRPRPALPRLLPPPARPPAARRQPPPPPPELRSMASRRMETKPVITCLKTLLIIYSFVFWVSGQAWLVVGLPSVSQYSDAPIKEGGGKKPKPKSNLSPLLKQTGAGCWARAAGWGRGAQAWGYSDPGPRLAQAARGCVVAVTADCRPFQFFFNALIYFLSSLDRVSL